MKKILFLLAAVVVFSGAGALLLAQEGEDKKEPEKEKSPTASSSEYYKLAAKYSADRDGVSMLVMVDGEVVFEDYPNGGSKDRAQLLASGTKSFCGIMAIVAVKEGLLSLDERVSDTITEWEDDEQKSEITVRQLLTLTSGLDPGKSGSPPTYLEAVQVKCISEPGEKFAYGPVAFQAFGELMRRKLAEKNLDPLQYLEEKVLKPIGLEYGGWKRGRDRNPNLPSGASLTARNWAKFGELVRCEGKWGKKQILDPELLKECFKGTKANPAYGLSWWLNKKAAPGAEKDSSSAEDASDVASGKDLPKDLVFAAGAGKQRLYIVPSLDLVVVRQARKTGRTPQGEKRKVFSDAEFFNLLLHGKSTAEDEDSSGDSKKKTGRKNLGQALRDLDLSEDQVKDVRKAMRTNPGGLRNSDFVKELRKILSPAQWKQLQKEVKKPKRAS